MAFSKTGVVTAPKIVPSALGLLAAVKPENAPGEDQWIRGFSQLWDTTVQNVTNWDDTDTTDGALIADATVVSFGEIKPFFIEVDDTRSTLGFLGTDRIKRISDQLEGVTQKAMEAELWDGAVRKGEGHANVALSDSAAIVLNSGAALSARRALALLEFEIGNSSPAGEQGVIHMTRDVYSLLTSTGDTFMFNEDKKRVETLNGTPVVVGSGYSGTGPDEASNAAASATNKWIYATGTVKTYLGNVDVVNDNLSQAYDVSGNQNDMRLKAIRPAAVYFDTSIHLAVRADLTA
jgi:hypothetical protein